MQPFTYALKFLSMDAINRDMCVNF